MQQFTQKFFSFWVHGRGIGRPLNTKKFGQKIGKRAGWKKAIVKLKSGDSLNFVESGGKI